MKNRNPIFIAIVFALAFAPVTKAVPNPGGIPTIQPVNNEQASPEGENRPVITIHSAGNILRGKTGSFVLEMKPALAFGGMYVNFKVGGTAVAGVDYVSLISPTYIGQSGFGALLLKTLPDPRASSGVHAYTVVVTLEPGAGYAVGKPSSAKILISTTCALEACW